LFCAGNVRGADEDQPCGAGPGAMGIDGAHLKMTDTHPIEQPISDSQHAQIIWDNLSDTQRQFVTARLIVKSDTLACQIVGIRPHAAAIWAQKKLIDQLIAYKRAEALQAAKFVLIEASLEAAGVLVKELHGKKRLIAAKEILDRTGLPAVSKQELSSGDNPIIVRILKASESQSGDQ
jgi:hypothetical protein